MSAIAIDHLSPAERLSLIGELWDSLDAAQVSLTEAQQAELDSRLATADEDAKHGTIWKSGKFKRHAT